MGLDQHRDDILIMFGDGTPCAEIVIRHAAEPCDQRLRSQPGSLRLPVAESVASVRP